jgi:hypothetical protein
MVDQPTESSTRIAALERRLAVLEGAERLDAERGHEHAETSGRRRFLKLAGAAAVGALGITAARESTAAAGTITAGAANDVVTITRGGDASGSVLSVSGTSSTGEYMDGITSEARGLKGFGLHGISAAGFGVVGESTTGVDLYAKGSGRLQLRSHGAIAPSPSGTYSAGEVIRADDGTMLVCVSAGSPGTWRRIAGPSTAGQFEFLPAPFRIYDSRPGTNPGSVGPKSPIVASEQRQLSVTIAGVPTGATGVVVNLAIVSVSGPGFIGTWATGPYPGTSSINWFGAGQILSNSVTIKLATSRTFELRCGQGSADVIVDVTGFFL